MTTRVDVIAGAVWSTTRGAEHAFDLLTSYGSGDVVSAATHFSASSSTVLVTVELEGGEVLVLGSHNPLDTSRVRALHAYGMGGRLFRYAGWDRLHGVMSVGRLVEVSAIDEVTMIGSRETVASGTQIDTQSFVRPQLVGGRLQLVVRPAADERVVPFEQPNPTPCCATH